MVSSTHWLASAAGMARLEAGGNAFDAVVAAGFTLQVAEPHLNGPGGDLCAIFAATSHAPTVLCGQGQAPAAATINHFAALGIDLVPGSGLLAAAVPGATVAWLTLLRDYGTQSLRAVTEASVGYALSGIPVLPQIAATIGSVAELFRNEWPTSAALYLGAGRWLRNPVWGATLTRLVTEAERATADRDGQIEHAITSWRTGFVAAALDAFVGSPLWDSSGDRHPGLLAADDLVAWAPTYEEPAKAVFRGLEVCKTQAWGQGPVLLQQLMLLDGFDLSLESAEFVHTVIECAKLAFADREAWYGDAQDVPLASLLSARYADERRRLVGDAAAGLDGGLRPGCPDGRIPRLPAALADAPRRAELAAEYDPTISEPTAGRSDENRGDTCHVSVVDGWGNIVAATPSGGWLQSSPAVPELGFPLGTRLQMTWLEEGLPGSLAAGRRPRTTLSPSLVLRDGEPALAFGTPGGDQQDQWQLGLVLHHVLGGRNLQESIEAPAFHTTHPPSSFFPRESFPCQVVLEDRIDAGVIGELRRRGHVVVVTGSWSLGRLSAVGRDHDGGLRAAANPRGMHGYAVGR